MAKKRISSPEHADTFSLNALGRLVTGLLERSQQAKAWLERLEAESIQLRKANARDYLAKFEAILGAAIEVNVPELVVARTAIGGFQSMICSKTAGKLDGWLEAAKKSLVGSFASAVEKDIDAVRNAVISPISHRKISSYVPRPAGTGPFSPLSDKRWEARSATHGYADPWEFTPNNPSDRAAAHPHV